MSEDILIIATGGTFDKLYDEISGSLTFKSSHLEEIMKRVRTTVPYSLAYLPLKDSLNMDEHDRSQILEACRTAAADRIIIIHGTDTMDITARLLCEAELEKTIILTGAMIPYTISNSDAIFNLGTAFSSVQYQEHGVYICMNGRTFPGDRVRKNRQEGIFEILQDTISAT